MHTLNKEQNDIYMEIIYKLTRKLNKNECGTIFIDAPGGTGKTYLLNVLLAKVRSKKKLR